MISDQALFGQLRDMWTEVDPTPGDLAERVIFTLQLEDLEVELMRLHEAGEPVGARGAEPVAAGSADLPGGAEPETATTVTFTSETLTVMLTLSRIAASDGGHLRRVDGWIAPAAALRIELRRGDGTYHTVADSDGRFSFEDVPAGLIQLRIQPTDGAAVSLARPVVTPPVQI